MNKQEFLGRLKEALAGLPQEDIEERLDFYSEMIDDKIEDGLAEDAAVAEIGAVAEVRNQIISDVPLKKLVREKMRPKRRLRAWEIILLVLGSPLWLSLLIAAFAIIISIYVAMWAVVISLWAVELAFIAGAFAAVILGIVFAFRGNGTLCIASVSTGFFLAGLSVFLFFGCREATKWILILTKKTGFGIKAIFMGGNTQNE